MTDSKYPTVLDSDIEIPQISDNITELGGDAINSLRSAVFNIEETLGINPQGSTSDVATRLNRSLNSDGSIKASALSAIGLITLPITDSMIATNAGIEESKLDLDYGTAWLKAGHDSNYALIISTMNELAIDIGHLTAHVAHPTTYGRHHTSDIDGYAGAVYDGYNLEGMVNDLNNRIIRHLANPVAAHAASAISFDDTNLPIIADNVQDAIKQTSLYIEGATIRHQDNLHSNGVLKSQNVYFDDTTHSYVLVSSNALNPFSAETIAVQFTSVPLNFAKITRGDRIDITISSQIYTRYVDYTSGGSTVFFLIPIPVASSNASAVVYKKSEEYINPSALNVAYRHRGGPGVLGGAIIQLVHPNAPFVLSSGIDPRNLSSGASNIKLGWGSTPYTTADINIYSDMVTNFSSGQSTWTVENLATQLNKDFSANHYPFIAFTYKGQLGVAFDEPDGYMAIQTPSGSSAWNVLGFTLNDIAYPLNRKFYIDGYGFTNIRQIVNTTGSVLLSNQQQITNLGQDIVALGVIPPGIVRVNNNTNNNGTYIFDNTNGTNTLVINENVSGFTVGSNISTKIYADTFSASPAYSTLYELFIDGYNHTDAVFAGQKRLEYRNISGSSIINYFSIIDVSRNFLASSKNLNYVFSGGIYTMQLGSGELVTLPSPSSSIAGYRFKTYSDDGTNYIELEVIANYISLPSGTIGVTIYDRPSEKRYLQVGKVLYDTNTSSFKYLEDRRLFGTIGRTDVRDDFTRDNITYPTSLLRGNGVIRDCSSSYSTTTFTLMGGEALVNGNICSIPQITFAIPKDGAMKYNLYIDGNGIVCLNADNQFVANQISTPSTQEIINSLDKTILYVINTNSSSNISTVADLRRFINNIDNKIDLFVGNINTGGMLNYGTFASLQSVIDYINNVQTDGLSRIIRIKGQILYDLGNGPLILPDSTILEGDKNGKGAFYGSKIVATGSTSDFIRPGINCTIRNLDFELALGSSVTNFIGNSNTFVEGLTVENCYFLFNGTSAQIFGSGVVNNNGISNLLIRNCNFDFFNTSFNNTLLCVLSGWIYKTTLENCRVHFATLTNINWIALAEIMTFVNFNNCYFDFPTTTTGSIGGIQGTQILNACSITNCVFICATNAGNTMAITTPLMENCVISENYFSNFYRTVWAGAVNCTKNYILNNIINGVGFRGIDLENINNCFISRNAINSSLHVLFASLIRLNKTVGSIISENFLTSDASGAPDGYMIHVLGNGQQNSVSNNICYNTALPDQGFLKGIYFDGAGSAVHFSESITDNIVANFTGWGFVTAYQNEGVHFEKTYSSIFSGNKVINCRNPLYTKDCNYLVITSNFLSNGLVATLTSASNPSLFIDGTSSSQEGLFLISNNIIHQFYCTVTTGIPTTAPLANITANSGFGGTVCNNIFILGATSPFTVINFPVLQLGASTYNVTGNLFYAHTNLGSILVPIISVSGNNCFVSANNLQSVISVAPRINMSGTGSIDYMNKGQTYEIAIPDGSIRRLEQSAFPIHSWYGNSFTDGMYTASDSSYNSSTNSLFHSFSAESVPVGAQIIKISANFNIISGTTSAVTFSWGKYTFGSFSTTYLNTGITPSGVLGPCDINPTTPPVYMEKNTVHFLRASSASSGSYLVNYYGLKITYIL